MPAAGVTKVPKRVIDRTVKRHLEGKERVTVLAKELGLVDATVYNWVAAHKRAELARIKAKELTPKNAAKAEKRDLALENEALKHENERLWAKVRELMLKTGEL